MKKFIVFFLVSLFALTAAAESVNLKATYQSHRVKYGNQWEEWSDWEPCDYLIILDGDKDQVAIYSETPQFYEVISSQYKEYYDGDAKVREIMVRNTNGEIGVCRIAVRDKGRQEIYLSFKNVNWGYIIDPTS